MADTAILNGKPKTNDDFDIVVLKFADSKIPEFKEVKNKDFILYGENNDYPEYLTYLYNKSAKHNAIINGKCNYILGSGFDRKTPTPGGFADFKNPDGTITPGAVVNKSGETMYDIWVKSVKDIEIYGGFRWLVSWNLLNQITDIYHEDFYKFRLGKGGNYFYKNAWVKDGRATREDPTIYPEFNPNPLPPGPLGQAVSKGIQVFAYNEYRPGCDYYPLPGYIGCNNYIDTDIEISKFHLSSIRNGMMPSKLIQFYTGEPTDEKKKEVERRFERKFGGSENAGKFVLVFNTNKDKSVDISDLSASELDKQFDLLNKTCQQEIFTGHQVVSPMLFGIKTEGQLGGNTELKTAYEVFINTYAKSKQANIERIVNYFGGLMGKGKDYFITQLDPVGLMFDVKDIVNLLPKEYIYEKLGIPKEYMGLPPVNPNNPIGPSTVQQEAVAVNDNIKNLTAKQHQQLVRIIRQYSKGQLTPEAAKILLKTGLALSDEEINSLLGIDEERQAFSADEDATIQVFNSHGDLKSDFHIIKSKKIKFSSDNDAFGDELDFYKQAFKTTDLTNAEGSILDLISKDKRITPEVIAKTLGTTPEYVSAKIGKLVKAGLLNTAEQVIGDDTQIERTLTKPLKDIIPPSDDISTTEIYIKYSYEGPRDDRNRPFCRKLLELDRLYSRSEIETISQRLGYSVWDRRGGWWTKPDGTHSPSCRHHWQSNIVVKKGGGK
jgi:hypothetical protein